MGKYFSLVLCGDWGTGKTTTAMTAPKPILVLDTDNKLHKMENIRERIVPDSIIQWPVTETLTRAPLSRMAGLKLEEGKDKLVVPRPGGYDQLCTMIDKLVASKCVVDGKKIETVVLDSYTSAVDHLKALIMACNGAMVMSQPLWGALLRNLEILNSTLLSLPANVIFICHEKIERDENSGAPVCIRPLIDGSMSQKIGKDFEEFYYTKRKILGKEVKFTLHPWGDSLRQGRTSRALPTEMEPDLSKILGGTPIVKIDTTPAIAAGKGGEATKTVVAAPAATVTISTSPTTTPMQAN